MSVQRIRAGEYYGLILFGAVGMCLMSSAVELVLIFIALEISSISTYILAGFRRRFAISSESSLKYFLLGSFATAFFLYGVSLMFGATGSTNIDEISTRLNSGAWPMLAPRIQSGRRPFPYLDARCLRRRSSSHRRLHVHRAESCRLRRSAARDL